MLTKAVLTLLGLGLACAQLHPDQPAKYVPLPSLREQAEIKDAWRDEGLTRSFVRLARAFEVGWSEKVAVLTFVVVFLVSLWFERA